VHHSRKGRIHAMRAAVFLLFYLPCLFMITLAVCVMAFSESAKRDPLRGRLLRFELSAFAYFLIDFLLTYSLLAFYGFDIFSGSAGATGIMKISMPIYAGYAVSNVAQFSLYYSICLIFLGLCGMDRSPQRRFLVGLPIFTFGLWTTACYIFLPFLYSWRLDAAEIYGNIRVASSIVMLSVFILLTAVLGVLWIRKRGQSRDRRKRILGDALAIVFFSYFPVIELGAALLSVFLPSWYRSPFALLFISPHAVNFIASLAVFVYFARAPRPVLDSSAANPLGEPFAAFALTSREEEIAKLILTGLSNKEICARLGISHGTVKNHVFGIFRKLGVQSRFELTKFVGGRR
jgi:DNA-binding CsgD family transcriptional regulator